MQSQSFSWLFVIASVIAEVFGTLGLRYAAGFTVLRPSLVVIVCYAAAIWWMSLAVRELEVGLTYAIWAGSGTALTAVAGIIWFDESTTILRLVGLTFIVAGVIVLNLDEMH